MHPFTEPHLSAPAACPSGVLPDGAITSPSPAKEHSVLRPLRAAILSLDWEISGPVVQRYDAELQRLEALWPQENIRLACLRILRALGKYITIHLAATPPEAISLVSSVYDGLEQIVCTPGMRDADKVTIVQGELKKYNELKKQLASLQKPARPQPAQPPPEPQPAAKVVPLAGASPWRQSVIEDLFHQPGPTPEDERIATQHLSVFSSPTSARQSPVPEEKETAQKPVVTASAPPITAEDIANKLNAFFDADNGGSIDSTGVVPLTPPETAEEPAISTATPGAPTATEDLLTSLFQEKPPTPADTLLADMHLQAFGAQTAKKAASPVSSSPPEVSGAAPPLDETAIRSKLDSFFDDEEMGGTDTSATGVVRLYSESGEQEAPIPLHTESIGMPGEKPSEVVLPMQVQEEEDRTMLRARLERLIASWTSEQITDLSGETLAIVADALQHNQLTGHAAHLEQVAATAKIAPLLSPALQDDARDIVEKLLRQILPALAGQGDKPGPADMRSLARAIARHAALVGDLLNRRETRESRGTPPAQPAESSNADGDIMDLTAL